MHQASKFALSIVYAATVPVVMRQDLPEAAATPEAAACATFVLRQKLTVRPGFCLPCNMPASPDVVDRPEWHFLLPDDGYGCFVAKVDCTALLQQQLCDGAAPM
jgi:hypothetical protein